MNFLNSTGLERLWAHILSKLNYKVDKVEGKGLSTEDFTTEEKEKLASLSLDADGTGGVHTVNGKEPDEDGNIELTADDVDAVSTNGGTMTGELKGTSITLGSTTDTRRSQLAILRKLSGQQHMRGSITLDGTALRINVASVGDQSANSTIDIGTNLTTFSTPIQLSSSTAQSTTRENLDVYSKSETDSAIADAVASVDGNSGVYIGNEEPTDPNVGVWIDLDEDGVDVIEPYTLPAATADTLGGVMIGEGLTMDGEKLGVKPENEYELIETITIAEDGIVQVSRASEPNGTPYNFKKVVVKNKIMHAEKGDALNVWFNNDVQVGTISTGAHATNTIYSSVRAWKENGVLMCQAANGSAAIFGTVTAYGMSYGRAIVKTDKNIEKIRIICATELIIPVGSTFEIWGVRA